jgi:four helix bundle protein
MARRSDRARAHFLNVAEASLAEAAYCIHVARRLGYVDEKTFRECDAEIRQVFGPLAGLFRATISRTQTE